MLGWTSSDASLASRTNEWMNSVSSARCGSIRLSAPPRSTPAIPRFLARWTVAIPPTPSRSYTRYGPNSSGTVGSAGFTVRLYLVRDRRLRADRRTLVERQLELAVVERPVHAELRDVAVVEQAAVQGVVRLEVLIREGIEHVVAADGELHVLGELIADLRVEQRLGAEGLAVGHRDRPVADLAVVVGADHRRQLLEGVAERPVPLDVRHRVLEPVVRQPIEVEAGEHLRLDARERVGQLLGGVDALDLGPGQVQRTAEQQRAAAGVDR